MSIVEAAEKQEKLISRIKATIGTLQRDKLWNDDKFFDEVKDLLTKGELSEERISRVVADALFNLKISQPEVEDVKKLVQAFPDSLKCKNDQDRLPIEQLTFYSEQDNAKSVKFGTKYITPLALEGLKHNIGGENMRGGLLRESDGKNTLQRLSKCCSDFRYLEPLKDLRRHKLLLKKDIVDFSLLYYSCIGKNSLKRFQCFIKDYTALIKTTYEGVPLLNAVIQLNDEESSKRSFKRCIKYSLPYYKHLLFLKDNEDRTALEQAITKFGETGTMNILREIFTKESAYPILHQVIVHQPKYYNLFLQWFPYMYHLRDENGRTQTQVMFSMNRTFLQENPSFWINQSTDQLEEKDPKTTLRPFASVAYGMLGNLNLSYQILRKHPSVIDVILEQRENAVDESNDKKRSAEADLEQNNKKKKREETAEATT
ncbi:hypothetical protein CTEN210_13280 [Chaetoceros tenuissimus]|uniref:Uncharacterized protein n=1 Tax=Chaetoceros tenuissimus TaxID=426638 RepID=A0AAD3D674_9STRA|nr:hypothetical protein CTEN210_13280 [Chaetoceros tenuissimus]